MWEKSESYPVVTRQPRPRGWSSYLDSSRALLVLVEGTWGGAGVWITRSREGVFISDAFELGGLPPSLPEGAVVFCGRRLGWAVLVQPTAGPEGCPVRSIPARAIPLDLREEADAGLAIRLPRTGTLWARSLSLEEHGKLLGLAEHFAGLMESRRRPEHEAGPALPPPPVPEWKTAE